MLSHGATDALVAAVREVARSEIMPRFRALSAEDITTKSGPDDLVTIADRAAEAALTDRIAATLPGAAIVGEEAASDDSGILNVLRGEGTVAIIDPVDGTWNYARGLATFGVIVAVQTGGRCVFGMIHDPVFDDWIAARRGEGAFLVRPGAVPARLSVRAPLPEAEETGYLPLGMFKPAEREVLAPILPRYARVQSLRCSAHEYRMIASGHADWLVAAQSKPWDHLAGQLLVEEAGGAWGTLDGSAYDPARCDTILLAATSERGLERLRGRVGGALRTG